MAVVPHGGGASWRWCLTVVVPHGGGASRRLCLMAVVLCSSGQRSAPKHHQPAAVVPRGASVPDRYCLPPDPPRRSTTASEVGSGQRRGTIASRRG